MPTPNPLGNENYQDDGEGDHINQMHKSSVYQSNPNHDTKGTKTLQENIPDISFDCSDGVPLQLVRMDKKTGSFEIIEETANVYSKSLKKSIGAFAISRKCWFLCISWEISNRKKFSLEQIIGPYWIGRINFLGL